MSSSRASLKGIFQQRDPFSGKLFAEPASGVEPGNLRIGHVLDETATVGGPVDRLVMNEDQFAIARDREVGLAGDLGAPNSDAFLKAVSVFSGAPALWPR